MWLMMFLRSHFSAEWQEHYPVDLVLIESQVRRNTRAQVLQHCTFTNFQYIMRPNTPIVAASSGNKMRFVKQHRPDLLEATHAAAGTLAARQRARKKASVQCALWLEPSLASLSAAQLHHALPREQDTITIAAPKTAKRALAAKPKKTTPAKPKLDDLCDAFLDALASAPAYLIAQFGTPVRAAV